MIVWEVQRRQMSKQSKNAESRKHDPDTHRDTYARLYGLSRAIGTHDDCQRMEELNDFGFAVGVGTDPLNAELLDRRHLGEDAEERPSLTLERNFPQRERKRARGEKKHWCKVCLQKKEHKREGGREGGR